MSLTRLNIAFISPDTSGFNSVLRYSTAQSQFVWDSSAYTFPANHQGTISGYTSGGVSPPSSYVNTIDKFPFSADGNATDVGDLSQARNAVAGQSSPTNGYTSGGNAPPYVNTIDKFPFAASGNASDVGDLSQARSASAGQSSATRGYTSGGGSDWTIDKFLFASNANATDVGNLTVIRYAVAGQNSNTSGYTSSGINNPGTNFNIIDKFPFASDANASDVGDLTVVRFYTAGQSSTTSGYTSGGYTSFPGPGTRNIIDKFPFASNANATDVGDLSQARAGVVGQSSTASGYTSGGNDPSSYVNTIDKFPFSSNANATDVGDLSQIRRYLAGQQV